MKNERIENLFPNLKTSGYSVTSEKSKKYNCIAWAAGETSEWWDLYQYWPPGVSRSNTLDSFTKAFESLGYVICESSELENGYEKVSIYANEEGKPKHAARQLSSGRWSSKLGALEDIEHELDGLNNSDYGYSTVIMKRPETQLIPKGQAHQEC